LAAFEKNVLGRNSRAPEGTGVFVELRRRHENISLMGNHLSKAKQVAESLARA
jgi:hypothetical protein